MDIIFRVCLFISGLINFIPVFISIFPHKINKAYGVSVSDNNLELLLRHRSILFGLVGGL